MLWKYILTLQYICLHLISRKNWVTENCYIFYTTVREKSIFDVLQNCTNTERTIWIFWYYYVSQCCYPLVLVNVWGYMYHTKNIFSQTSIYFSIVLSGFLICMYVMAISYMIKYENAKFGNQDDRISIFSAVKILLQSITIWWFEFFRKIGK